MAQVLTRDTALGQRIRSVLEAGGAYHVDVTSELMSTKSAQSRQPVPASLLIVEINSQDGAELSALENMLQARIAPSAVVVISHALAGDAARRLLRLQVSDWLPRIFTDQELVTACNDALTPAKSNSVACQAHCTSFWSAVGGAGATTLGIAAASILAGKKSDDLASCCIIDLNFQNGTLADHLDLEPHLQLAEISGSPERVDAQMLEVMLSRHASGLAILAAPPSLGALDIGEDVVGKLLDLAAVKFKHLIFDLPRAWLPWSEAVLRGSDRVYIVTDLSVAGLRHARRTADALADRGVTSEPTVIVNKTSWLGQGAGVGKAQARKVLGNNLGGFVTDCPQLTRDAQNRGVLLSQVKSGNRIESDLGVILRAPRVTTTATSQ